jgi:hypothetical protein
MKVVGAPNAAGFQDSVLYTDLRIIPDSIARNLVVIFFS